MRKNLAFWLAVLSSLLVVSSTVGSAGAASYSQLGVETGDIADYSLIRDYPYPINMSTSARLNFTSVTGTYVRLTFTSYYPNGTVSSKVTRVGNASIGANLTYAYAIATNLAQGDPVFSGATATINETMPLAIAGLQRMVNHLKINVGLAHFDFYWDQATGLIVKSNWRSVSNGFDWQNVTLTSTSVFSESNVPPGFDVTVFAVVGGAVAVTAVAAIVAMQKRR